MGQAVPYIIAAVGSAATAYGHARAGQSQNLQYERQAQIQDISAAATAEAGKIHEERLRLKQGQEAGAQVASIAASGADVGAGTPLELRADTAWLAEHDIALARSQAAWDVWQKKSTAAYLRNLGTLAEATGRSQAWDALAGGFAQMVGRKYGGGGAPGVDVS